MQISLPSHIKKLKIHNLGRVRGKGNSMAFFEYERRLIETYEGKTNN